MSDPMHSGQGWEPGLPTEPGREPTIELAHGDDGWRLPAEPPAPTPRWGLAGLLFALTFLTTTTLGAHWALAIRTDTVSTLAPDGVPLLLPSTIMAVWGTPELLAIGLSFSIPALFILLCHELGHYLACRYYRLTATLPYFLPLPAVLGTLGAFIRIKSPIERKRELFDVGIAGPIAGFVALLPFLVIGIARSTPVELPDIVAESSSWLVVPGHNLALTLTRWLVHGPLPAGWGLDLHPFALAAWFGMLATALNLLPLGQLDGGHIFYAAAGRWHRRLALPLWLTIAMFSLYWRGWLLWCLILLVVVGLRHPPVLDEDQPLDRRRQRLAVLALLLLVLSFMPVPLAQVPVDLDIPTTPQSGPDGSLEVAAGATSKTNVTGPSLTSSTSM